MPVTARADTPERDVHPSGEGQRSSRSQSPSPFLFPPSDREGAGDVDDRAVLDGAVVLPDAVGVSLADGLDASVGGVLAGSSSGVAVGVGVAAVD